MQAKVYSVARPPIQSTAHDRVAWQAHGVAVVRIGIAVLMNGARKPRNYRYHGVLPGGARPCGQWIQPVGELTLTRTLIGVYVPAAKRPLTATTPHRSIFWKQRNRGKAQGRERRQTSG